MGWGMKYRAYSQKGVGFCFLGMASSDSADRALRASLQCSLSRVICKRFLLYALCAVRDGGYGLRNN
jgi:hypothetical protein